MATEFWSTPLDHSGDAGFQAWATELYDGIINAGMVQTADSGQLGAPVGASRPSTNTAAGYWVFRFDDTQQASMPLYLKVEVGTANAAANPMIWLTVGTGTNGSGSLTGVVTTRRSAMSASAVVSTVTSYPSYICCTEGFFGVAFKVGSTGAGVRGTFMVERSVGSNGLPNSEGATVHWLTAAQGASNNVEAISNVTNTVYIGTVAQTCTIPLAIASSVIGATPQVFKHYSAFPRMRPNPYLLTCRSQSEIPQFNQFLATPVGAVQHNYIALGTNGAGTAPENNSHIAMVWE
jgi:hypothetical protein